MMTRQQKRKLDREQEKNVGNYAFSHEEYNIISNCITKIKKEGLVCVGSIQRLITPAPIETDNFIAFRIGLAGDIIYAIDCGTDYILKRGKVSHHYQNLNGLLFVNCLLMRNILRRISDLAFLWKNPKYTADYREHQMNNEPGEWAMKRLGITYENKTEQGIILVIEEIYQDNLTNDYFKNRSRIFNEGFYGKHAIERYLELHDQSDKNNESIRKTKGNIMQCVLDFYGFVDLVLRGFQKYEQVTMDKNPLDITADINTLYYLRQQYQV